MIKLNDTIQSINKMKDTEWEKIIANNLIKD